MSTSTPIDVVKQRRLRRDLRDLRIMALGFGIGSILFGAGAVMAMLGAAPEPTNVTFALGAVGFTTAALVQLISSMLHFPAGPRRLRRALTDPDVTSAAIQFIGTLYFNLMTIRAVVLPPTAADYHEIWGPDVLGSALFLISSWIAWHPIVRERRHEFVSRNSEWILRANMAGSGFFAISAWGAKLLGSGTLQNVLWDNLGTFLGAVGFLIASVLLWPRRESSYAAG